MINKQQRHQEMYDLSSKRSFDRKKKTNVYNRNNIRYIICNK